MPDPSHSSTPFGSLALIALVTASAAGVFAYTAGWLTPDRLTPGKLVSAFAPKTGPALGHRRNHAKGICFTGTFDANGNGEAYSKALVFVPGQYSALGRFNLGTPNPDAADGTVRVRGLGLQITTPDGETWRSAMINAPVFPVSNPDHFYALLKASHSMEPDAMKNFAEAYPEFAPFARWTQTAPWTTSYAEDRFNSLNAYIAVAASGAERAIRWSLLPEAEVVPRTQAEVDKLGLNHLEEEIAQRVAGTPQRWTMILTLANPGDPTSDPSKTRPEDRQTINVGTLIVQKIEAERDGPCRDINFDPTIVPNGIKLSDDPFPPARSSAYAKSYDLRTAEAKDYPYHSPTAEDAQP